MPVCKGCQNIWRRILLVICLQRFEGLFLTPGHPQKIKAVYSQTFGHTEYLLHLFDSLQGLIHFLLGSIKFDQFKIDVTLFRKITQKLLIYIYGKLAP